MKANELILTAFTKIGLALPSEIATILGEGKLASLEVDATVSDKLAGDFFTKESALQNPEIRSAIKAEVLNGTDADIERLMTKFEFDDATKGVVKAGDKTSKRLEFLVDKVAELTSKKAGKSTGDKDVLTKKIEELNAEIVTTKNALTEKYEAELGVERTARKSDKINWELDSIYNGFDYALAADKKISVTAARAIIESNLTSKGLKFDLSDTGIKILTKEGTEFFDNNVKISPTDYIKKNLIENKLIKVSDGKPAAAQQRERQPQEIKQHTNNSFKEALDSRLAEQD